MVLIFGLLGCLSARGPVPTGTPVPVTTVVTLVNPEAGQPIKPTDTVLGTFQSHFESHGWKLESMTAAGDFHQLGTSKRRAQWLMEHTDEDLAVLIETEARPRSQLGGRFQWVVDASIIVVSEESEPTIRHARFPTTLPHIHQSELDALQAVAPRIAAQAAGQIELHQK